MYTTKPVKSAASAATATSTAAWRPPLDGLDTARAAPVDVEIPGVLTDALLRLRLLEGVPLAWLVPDPELLPPESIRFFHVDPTWTDRLVDGALSAGRVGSLDIGFTAAALAGIREHLDEVLEARAGAAWAQIVLVERGAQGDVALGMELASRYAWPGRLAGAPPPLCGVLVRSELVTRWPDFAIRGFRSAEARDAENAVPILRRARLGDDLLIVLFAGIPQRVEFEEPPTGIRFGVEQEPEQKEADPPVYVVQGREAPCAGITLTVPVDANRMLSLSDAIQAKPDDQQPGKEHPARGSQWFAWWFLQPPYIQVFSGGGELSGSIADPPKEIKVRGRTVPLRPPTQR